MVDVSMGENDSIQTVRRNGKRIPVSLPEGSPALKKPTVDQQTLALDSQKKATSGHRLSCSKKLQGKHHSDRLFGKHSASPDYA